MTTCDLCKEDVTQERNSTRSHYHIDALDDRVNSVLPTYVKDVCVECCRKIEGLKERLYINQDRRINNAVRTLLSNHLDVFNKLVQEPGMQASIPEKLSLETTELEEDINLVIAEDLEAEKKEKPSNNISRLQDNSKWNTGNGAEPVDEDDPLPF